MLHGLITAADSYQRTHHFLIQILDSPGWIGSDEVKDKLYRLSQKIDVNKRLWSSYDCDWKKQEGDQPLTHYYWPIMILALITFSV